MWINGQVHGPEINGVLAALDFVNALQPAGLSGSIVVTATANPLALNTRTKTTQQDEGDLDQSFPGNAGGLREARNRQCIRDAAVNDRSEDGVSKEYQRGIHDAT